MSLSAGVAAIAGPQNNTVGAGFADAGTGGFDAGIVGVGVIRGDEGVGALTVGNGKHVVIMAMRRFLLLLATSLLLFH